MKKAILLRLKIMWSTLKCLCSLNLNKTQWISSITGDIMKKRTWHYIQHPHVYEMRCDKCKGQKIYWSEFEHMIWCFDCKIDTPGDAGMFDGPIPVNTSHLMGIYFDRYNMEKNRYETPVQNEGRIDWVKMTDKELNSRYKVTNKPKGWYTMNSKESK